MPDNTAPAWGPATSPQHAPDAVPEADPEPEDVPAEAEPREEATDWAPAAAARTTDRAGTELRARDGTGRRLYAAPPHTAVERETEHQDNHTDDVRHGSIPDAGTSAEVGPEEGTSTGARPEDGSQDVPSESQTDFVDDQEEFGPPAPATSEGDPPVHARNGHEPAGRAIHHAPGTPATEPPRTESAPSAPGAPTPEPTTTTPPQDRSAEGAPENQPSAPGGALTRFGGALAQMAAGLGSVGRFIRPGGGPGASAPANAPQKTPRLHPAGSATSAPEDDPVARPSEEEVEQRLTLSLRETVVEGFTRVAVGSPKGGVGKSSIAYALAGSVAYYTNIRVCLVDADPEFGATRLMVPRPIQNSVVEMARDADSLHRLSDIRRYTAQNERMRVDVVLNPPHMSDKAAIDDLPAAYKRIDEVLSRVYDLVIYDMGLGFSHPQIQTVLGLSDGLLLVGDSERLPNTMLADALDYLNGLDVDVANTSLCINHRLPPTDESALAGPAKQAYGEHLRRITEVPYDATFSQLLNRRAMHIEDLPLKTRLGVLTTAGAVLEGLRNTDARTQAEARRERHAGHRTQKGA